MDLSQIKELVKKGESNTLEFKKTTGLLQSAFETICGYLNGKGGTVLIGVADDRRIIGQEVGDKTLREISNEINKLEPPANVNIEYLSVGGDNKKIIILQVQAGKHGPYVFDMLDQNLILSSIRAAVENRRLPESALKQEIPKILEALELIDGIDIKNAAVVLFGTKFPADFYQCQI